MSDRFKVRMWDSKNKKMWDSSNDGLLETVFECLKQQLAFDDGVKAFEKYAYNHSADGRVFMQCTGLRDKNGVLIYEGDICRIKGFYIVNEEGYKIKQKINKTEVVESLEQFFGEALLQGVYSALACPTLEVEIIGNIHENEDLLGGM